MKSICHISRCLWELSALHINFAVTVWFSRSLFTDIYKCSVIPAETSQQIFFPAFVTFHVQLAGEARHYFCNHRQLLATYPGTYSLGIFPVRCDACMTPLLFILLLCIFFPFYEELLILIGTMLSQWPFLPRRHNCEDWFFYCFSVLNFLFLFFCFILLIVLLWLSLLF